MWHIFYCYSNMPLLVYGIRDVILEHEFWHHIGGVNVGVLATGKHTTLRRKGKDLLAQNSENVSEWRDMPTNRLLSQWSSTIKITFSVLVEYKADIIIISLHLTYSRNNTAEILPILRIKGNFANKLFFYMFFLMYKYGCLYVY